MHSPGGLLPSGVPSFTHVPHRPIRQLGVTAFTPPGEGRCCVAEQWTGVGKSCGQPRVPCGPPVDNKDQGSGKIGISTGCGDPSTTSPQPAEQGRRRGEGATCGQLWDNVPIPRLWTAVSDPICGEPPRHAGIRTQPGEGPRGNRGAGPPPSRHAHRPTIRGTVTGPPGRARRRCPAGRPRTPPRAPPRPGHLPVLAGTPPRWVSPDVHVSPRLPGRRPPREPPRHRGPGLLGRERRRAPGRMSRAPLVPAPFGGPSLSPP